MIFLEFLAMAYLGRRFPDTHPLWTLLFIPIALATMVAEGLQ